MHAQPLNCAVVVAPACASGEPHDIFFDDLEVPAAGNWRSYAVAGAVNRFYYPQIPNGYYFDATYAQSGVTNIWGYGIGAQADFAIAMTRDVIVPPNALAGFDHAYMFEPPDYDGGLVEYSTDGGVTWLDVGPLFMINGYPGIVAGAYDNPLGARQAFVGASQGYLTSGLDLRALSGQTLRLRSRIGTDRLVWDYGWFIGNVRIYSCAPAPEETVTDVIPTTPTTTVVTPDATATLPPPTATATPYRVRLPAVRAL